MSARGYSLLEVAIGTALLGIITLVPLFLLGRSGHLSRLDFEVTLIAQILERALSEATQRGTSLDLHVDPSGLRLLTDRDTPVTTHTTSGGITLHLDSSLPGVIRLFPSGVATPATVTVREGERHCALVLSLRGRVRRACDEMHL